MVQDPAPRPRKNAKLPDPPRPIDQGEAPKPNAAAPFQPAKTLCTVCRAACLVQNTRREPRADGGFLVYRSFRCTGPRRHTFTTKSFQPAGTSENAKSEGGEDGTTG